MQQSTDIQIIADFSPNASIILGREKKLRFSLANISQTEKAYNVSAELIVSNGMDLVHSNPEYTSFTQDDSKKYTTTNIKDLAPQEGDFTLEYTLGSLETFEDGFNVPFGENLTAVLNITWDSMPRGNEDIGNVEYFNSYNIDLTASQVSVIKTLPQKYVKGAGNESLTATRVFNCHVEIQNNNRQSSSFTISDILPNGFRYLGGITIVEAILNPLPTPVVTLNSENGTQQLFFESITMQAGETLKFYYKAAIYDRYTLNGIVNSGLVIPHGTNLEGSISLTDVETLDSMNYSMKAMDIIISTSQNKSIVDCSDEINFNLLITANQYHNINGVQVISFVPDGQNPILYPDGTQGEPTPEFRIPIEYDVGNVAKDTTQTFSLTTEVLYSYQGDGSSIACGDQFLLNSQVNGTNADSSVAVADADNISQSIIVPTIQKTIVNKFYRNLTTKTISALARLDYVEYQLTYDSTGIEAAQKGIELDDYFPLECYLPEEEDINQISGPEVAPITVSPHGLRWELGEVGAQTVWSVKVKVQVTQTADEGHFNNLFKLNGITSHGSAYSKRDNTLGYIGEPNIVVTRTMDGINPSKVESGQRYQASVTFTNTQTQDNTATDAFDFNIFAELLNGIIVHPESVVISGTGSWNDPLFEGERIIIYLKRLKVGEYATIYYEASIPNNIPPSYAAVLASQSEIPYTQPFDIAFPNVEYQMEVVRTNFVLRSAAMGLTKGYDTGVKQVGSTLEYTTTAIIPKGTAVFNCNIVDTLPSQQSYVGGATFNGEEVTPEVVGSVITFPNTAYFYHADEDVMLSYKFTAQIDDVTLNNADVIQTNYVSFNYDDYNSVPKSMQAFVNVDVSNPLLSLELSSENDSLSSSQATKLTLLIKNLGKVSAGNVAIEADIPSSTQFVSASSTIGTPIYDDSLRKIDLDIGTIPANSQVVLNYYVKGVAPLSVGDTVNMSAISDVYTNTIDDKQYPAQASNDFQLEVYAGLIITIYPPYRSQSGNGYVMVAPNSIAYVPYTIVNKGGGTDSLHLNITPSKYPYEIELNNQVVETVPQNTVYDGTPTGMETVASGAMVKFRLIFEIPDTQLYDRNPYTITVESLSDPDTKATIFTDMVDP